MDLEPQDQYCYNDIATVEKLLDVIIPMQLPEEAKIKFISLKKKKLCFVALMLKISIFF